MLNIEFNPHLVIIGNGFDISLGFKTRYEDFLNSNHFQKSNFRNDLLATHLQNKSDIQNWVDVEKEIDYISSMASSNNITPEHFKEMYQDLKKSLVSYLKEINTKNSKSICSAREFIDSLGQSSISFKVVNFNYTDCAKITIEQITPHAIYTLTHIHGSLQENEIIFGVQDKSNASEDHPFVKKSYSKIFSQDRNNLHNDLLKHKRISIFGHSLGESDHHYFSEFFSNPSLTENKIFDIYYHGEKSRDDIYKQLNTLTGNSVGKLKANCFFNEIDTSAAE